MTQNIATVPMAYGGKYETQAGRRAIARSSRRRRSRTATTKINCPASTPTLNISSASGHCERTRQHSYGLRERTGEAKAVQQAETECYDPRRARRQPRAAAKPMHYLGGHKDDAQRNGRLQRGTGHMHPPECGGH